MNQSPECNKTIQFWTSNTARGVYTLELVQRIQDELLSVHPVGGILQADRCVLISPDNSHLTIVRQSSFLDKKDYSAAVSQLLDEEYILVNGIVPVAIMPN